MTHFYIHSGCECSVIVSVDWEPASTFTQVQDGSSPMLSRRTFQKGLLGTLAAAAMPRHGISQPAAHAITAVDSHAHVFKRGLPLADARRYAPDYDATPEDYIAVLDKNGVSNAVLVQPSFFGTDNTYMVEALKRYGQRFRGIAVVAPDVAQDELRALNDVGVVGIRLNLIGAPDPQLEAERHRERRRSAAPGHSGQHQENQARLEGPVDHARRGRLPLRQRPPAGGLWALCQPAARSHHGPGGPLRRH